MSTNPTECVQKTLPTPPPKLIQSSSRTSVLATSSEQVANLSSSSEECQGSAESKSCSENSKEETKRKSKKKEKKETKDHSSENSSGSGEECTVKKRRSKKSHGHNHTHSHTDHSIDLSSINDAALDVNTLNKIDICVQEEMREILASTPTPVNSERRKKLPRVPSAESGANKPSRVNTDGEGEGRLSSPHGETNSRTIEASDSRPNSARYVPESETEREDTFSEKPEEIAPIDLSPDHLGRKKYQSTSALSRNSSVSSQEHPMKANIVNNFAFSSDESLASLWNKYTQLQETIQALTVQQSKMTLLIAEKINQQVPPSEKVSIVSTPSSPSSSSYNPEDNKSPRLRNVDVKTMTKNSITNLGIFKKPQNNSTDKKKSRKDEQRREEEKDLSDENELLTERSMSNGDKNHDDSVKSADSLNRHSSRPVLQRTRSGNFSKQTLEERERREQEKEEKEILKQKEKQEKQDRKERSSKRPEKKHDSPEESEASTTNIDGKLNCDSQDKIKVKKSQFGTFFREKPKEDKTKQAEEWIPTLDQRIVTACCERLTQGINTAGLFRVPGSHSGVEKIYGYFKSEEKIKMLGELLEAEDNLHNVAGVLKQYLRNVRPPIFPYSSFNSLMDASAKYSISEDTQFLINETIKLPFETLAVLKILFKFLNELSKHSEENKMDKINIGIVFGPTLLRQDPAIETPLSSLNYSTQVSNLIVYFLECSEKLF